jgi:hypothetical protein
MEKGNTRPEPSIPYMSMHQDIQDVKMDLKTFDELRKAWVAWAKAAMQDLQSQGSELGLLDEPDLAKTEKTV